jgi:hypothetical protein
MLGAGEMTVGASYRHTLQLVPYNFLARCSDESLVLCIELTCTVLRYGSGIATQYTTTEPIVTSYETLVEI